jgi:hypothetical protein
VLRVKRTLDGAEIDKIISDRQARQPAKHWRPNIGDAPTGVSESYRSTVLTQNVITTMTRRGHIPHKIGGSDCEVWDRLGWRTYPIATIRRAPRELRACFCPLQFSEDDPAP